MDAELYHRQIEFFYDVYKMRYNIVSLYAADGENCAAISQPCRNYAAGIAIGNRRRAIAAGRRSDLVDGVKLRQRTAQARPAAGAVVDISSRDRAIFTSSKQSIPRRHSTMPFVAYEVVPGNNVDRYA
ncbi:hypothetical protein EVAR_61903_1 [Eumeta japonica]|uniref:Uncharacterized protein n=1 Tax=Eumeta variegata TaxID=151549 RepID=A0A4C1YMC6_EUMVA|nr:hypothetical protein EVAR_61903_1 [Eumeta japonica]